MKLVFHFFFPSQQIVLSDYFKGRINKSYQLNLVDELAEINRTDNIYTRHAMIDNIVGPENTITSFAYENVIRKHKGITYFNDDYPSFFEDKIQHDFLRLNKVTEVSGRSHEFDYYDVESSFTEMVVGETGRKDNSQSDFFSSTGREPYNSHIVKEHRILDSETGPLKEKITYQYYSDLPGTMIQRQTNGKYLPTDLTRYQTDKKHFNDQDHLVSRTNFIYRQYHTQDYTVNNSWRYINDPSSSAIKLLEKKVYFNGSSTGEVQEELLTQKELYEYETGVFVRTAWGNYQAPRSMSTYNGMFFEKEIQKFKYKNGVEIKEKVENNRTYATIEDTEGTIYSKCAKRI